MTNNKIIHLIILYKGRTRGREGERAREGEGEKEIGKGQKICRIFGTTKKMH